MTRYTILFGADMFVYSSRITDLALGNFVTTHGNGKDLMRCSNLSFGYEDIILIHAHGSVLPVKKQISNTNLYGVASRHVQNLCLDGMSVLYAIDLQKKAHFELFSCYSGQIMDDLKGVVFPGGSTFITLVGNKPFLNELGMELAQKIHDKGSGNPYIRYIQYFFNNPDETSLAVFTKSGPKFFKTNIMLLEKFDRDSVSAWRYGEIGRFQEFINLRTKDGHDKHAMTKVMDYIQKIKNTPDSFSEDLSRFLENILISATHQNNIKVLKKILQDNSGVDVEATLSDKSNPLSIASNSGYTEAVRLLLSYGANPNMVVSEVGLTPFSLAIIKNHINVVRLLLRYGADPNHAEDYASYTPFTLAISDGLLEVTRALLSSGRVRVENINSLDEFVSSTDNAILAHNEIEEYRQSPIKYILSHSSLPDAITFIGDIDKSILYCLRDHAYEVEAVGLCDVINTPSLFAIEGF